jgi:hypothetical protein
VAGFAPDKSTDQETTLLESEQLDIRRKALSQALSALGDREPRIFEKRRLAEDPITGIVKVTTVRRDVTQYDKIVAGFMTQERATPPTKPTVFLCRFHG